MGHLSREGSVRGLDRDGCEHTSGGMLEPLAGEEGGEGTGGGLDAAEGVRGAVQTFTPLALVAKTGLPMWSARTQERPSLPSQVCLGVRRKIVHWTVFCSASPFDHRDRLPPVPDVFADKGSGGLIVAAIRRPSLSKTEWMVTTDGEVDRRKLVRGAGIGAAIGRGPELGGQPVADPVMGA